MRPEAVDPELPIRIQDQDAVIDDAPGLKELEKKTKKKLAELEKLQGKLYADGRYALLVVLQGRDAAGKDGTVRKVFSGCNPAGCTVTSFKEPTPLERKHDFLWRVHAAVPPRGMIGIFNRSHYEDVIVPRVHGTVATPIINSRYDQINDFERMLVANNVIVLKFFLHISRAEQKKRLLKRIVKYEKNWKFREGDLDDRTRWNDFSEAYKDALKRCSTPEAPWYLVPADDKKVRDNLVTSTVVRTLSRLGLRYPEADPNTLLAAEQALS